MYIDIGYLLRFGELAILIAIAVSLLMLVRYRRLDFEFRRREYSANFIKDWNHPDLIETQAYIQNILGPNSEQLSYSRLKQELEIDRQLYFKITKQLNFFEEMAQSIDSHLSDEEYLKRYFLVTALNTFHTFKPFIELQREQLKTDQPFVSFEKLVYRWERLYKNEVLLPKLKRDLQ